MRAKNLLLSIIAVCSAFIASAENADTCIQVQRTQEQFQKEFKEFIDNTRAYIISKHIIPVDSTHLLSREQKFTLKYAKNPDNIFGDDNAVYLPLEVNHIIGDTINTKLVSVAQWKDAYFIKNKDYRAMLIIPLEAESKVGKIQSELEVIYDHNGYVHRIVLSNFAVGEDSIQEKILVKSNIRGLFAGATIYNSNDKVIAEVKGKYKNIVTDYLGNYPDLRNKDKNKIVYPKIEIKKIYPSNTVYKNDWRHEDSRSYFYDSRRRDAKY